MSEARSICRSAWRIAALGGCRSRAVIAAVVIGLTLAHPARAEPISLQEAIARILARNPDIDTARANAQEFSGFVTQAEGDFDWVLGASLSSSRTQSAAFNSTTFTESEETEDLRSAVVEATKKFRNSWELSLSNTTSYSKLRGSTLGNVTSPIGTSDWSATVTVPLMKGAGRDSATAALREAMENLVAARLQNTHDITQVVRVGANAYWTALAVRQNIDVLTDAMERARNLADLLVVRRDAQEIPEADYQRAVAELNLREVDVLDALTQAFAAQEALFVVMGYSEGDTLPEPTTEFPIPPSFAELDAISLDMLRGMAMDNRLDVAGARRQIVAATIGLDESVSDLDPDLDLELSTGYGAQRPKFRLSETPRLYSDRDELNGPNYSAALVFSYPLGNNFARGSVISERAAVEQLRSQLRSLENDTKSDVSLALSEMRYARQRYDKAQQALALFEEVAKETQRKLNNGEATLTDLVSIEDRLAETRLQIIASQQDYAQALIDLRFATGTLAYHERGQLLFDVSMFTTIPTENLRSIPE